MGRTEELAKIDRAIKDAEIRIRTVHTSLVALNKDISEITTLEYTLKENLACLKKKQVVAIAQEYKKAKEELRKTQLRLTMLTNDREHYEKTLRDAQSFLDLAKRDYIRMSNLMEKNVIKFRKKDG